MNIDNGINIPIEPVKKEHRKGCSEAYVEGEPLLTILESRYGTKFDRQLVRLIYRLCFEYNLVHCKMPRRFSIRYGTYKGNRCVNMYAGLYPDSVWGRFRICPYTSQIWRWSGKSPFASLVDHDYVPNNYTVHSIQAFLEYHSQEELTERLNEMRAYA